MPVAHRPLSFIRNTVPPGVGAPVGGLPTPGVAVALENGQVVLCGSNTFASKFYGFLYAAAAAGAAAIITTGRGSIVTPVITGGGPLNLNLPVFLSTVAGEVTQTPPVTGRAVRVGFAVTTTTISLNTDSNIGM